MKRACILAAVAAIGSLTIVPTATAEVRVGKNYRLNSDPNAFRGKDQLGMAVNPNNPQHIVAVNCEYLTQQAEGTRSLDGGQTWSTRDTLDPPASTPPFQPGCRISNHLAESMFQTVSFGTGNNVYATFQTPKTTLAGGEEGSSVFVSRSTDGGATWGTAVQAMVGGVSPVAGPYWELPTVTVDPGQGTGGADRVIVAARETTPANDTGGDVNVSVSNDNGATWPGAPVRVETAGENVAGPDSASQPVVLEDHSILITWRVSGATAFIKSSRSTDGGQIWSTPVNVTGVTAGGNTSNTNPPVPLQSSGSSFPRIAVDRAATPDRIYIVYNQDTPPGPGPGPYDGADHFIGHESDVYFQRSSDSGATWTTPKLINDTTVFPGNQSPGYGPVTQTRHPNVSVAPNGRVDITWEDRRHWYRGCIHTHVICDEARLGDTYYAFSNNANTAAAAAIAFSPDQRITDKSHNNDVGYDYRFGVGWAFGPLAVPMGNNELLVGWMDSREGSFDTDINDIYLARVTHTGPATPAQETLPHPGSPQGLALALSRHTYVGGGEGLLASTFATRNGTKAVIVNENDYPAILAAGVLARANLSQVLVSPAGGLPQAVKDEVTRMNPAGAYVIGDTTALSSQVVTDLENAGVPNDADQIERIGTADDAQTAHDIAVELDRRTDAQKSANEPAFHSVAVVNPASPDAAAVAGLAANRRLPILFTNADPASNTLPAPTADALDSAGTSDLDINDALVIGGTQWINNTAAGLLPSATRLGGANQYETSAAVIDESRDRGVPDNISYVANGASPIDAALLGSAVGRIGALLQLAPAPIGPSSSTAAFQSGIAGTLDRQILVQPTQAGGGTIPTYPTPGGGLPSFSGCPSSTANVILGTAGNDVRNGTPAGDRIFVGTGNDVVDGLAGSDCIDLGPGADRGQGGLGNDLILGGLGGDRISGSSGNDRLRGNPGNDRINAGRGNDRAFGDAGNDRIAGSFGNDRLHGVGGRDRISGSRGRDRINGGASPDTISGGSSGDRIAGDQGSDRINGNSGNDRIAGNSGNDRIRGGSGRDRISGGSGRDRIAVRDGQVDRVNCGSGRDRVSADGIDIVSGNCEIVSVAGASAASAAEVGSLGLPAVAGGAYVALLGWRRRRSRTDR